jgi:hypothetical protein
MRRPSADLPDLVPILSRGKHRTPRKGACFMEMASYLAGERWSDHPRCTHPLLSSAARLINDFTSDEHRQRLAGLIPSVIGLTTDDARADIRIALRCATAALPIASAERQNVMAVAVLAAERALARGEVRPFGPLSATSVEALNSAPLATRWALEFSGRADVTVEEFRRFGAPNTVRVAVPAIAQAVVPDPDERLHDLLVALIGECAAVCGRHEESSRDPVGRSITSASTSGTASTT